MAKRGPPSTFTRAIGAALCDRVGNGESLNAACAGLGLPRRRVRNWLVRYPSFGAEMAVAQQMHWDQMAEEVVDIIDRCDGSSQAEVTKARAASDARKWVLSKVRPAQFGDRLQVAGDPDQPLIPAEVEPSKIALGVLALLESVRPRPLPELHEPRAGTVLAARPAEPVDATAEPARGTPLSGLGGNDSPSQPQPTEAKFRDEAREIASVEARRRGWSLFGAG